MLFRKKCDKEGHFRGGCFVFMSIKGKMRSKSNKDGRETQTQNPEAEDSAQVMDKGREGRKCQMHKVESYLQSVQPQRKRNQPTQTQQVSIQEVR